MTDRHLQRRPDLKANPPWVTPFRWFAKNVSSTPYLMGGAESTCFIDSINVVNTTSNSLLFDSFLLVESGSSTENPYFAYQVPISGYGKQEILNVSINSQGISSTPTIAYMIPGDLLYVNSDFSENTFDCLVFGRQLTEI